MEQETSTEKLIPEGTIYKDRAMWVGAAIGGPLVTGYLAASNYKVFGEKDKVWKTWLVAVAATVLIFSIALYAPFADRIPNGLFGLITAGMAYLIVRIWQGAKIDAHVRAGGRVFSWYRVIGISIVGLILTAISFLTFAYFNGEFSESITTKTYGTLKHEILYDKNNITEAEVDKIADALTRRDFFDTQAQKFVYVKKINNSYEIFISCSDVIKTDPSATTFFTELRKEIQTFFPDNKIIFNLTVGNSIDNVVKRLE
jgi:hypothetical protein